MALYRAYILTTEDCILAFQLLECPADAVALTDAARIRAHCAAIEVWEGTRLVGRVVPASGSKPQCSLRDIEPDVLADALEEMDQAFAIYDTHDRLVVFNRRYAEVRSAIGGDVVTGVPWNDLIEASVAARAIPEARGREKSWLDYRRQVRGDYRIIRHLPDGRAYQIDERRMPSGIVVVWTEVTRLLRCQITPSALSAASSALDKPSQPP